MYMGSDPPGPPDPGNLQFMNLENYYRVQEDALVRQFENRRRMLAQEHQVNQVRGSEGLDRGGGREWG